MCSISPTQISAFDDISLTLVSVLDPLAAGIVRVAPKSRDSGGYPGITRDILVECWLSRDIPGYPSFTIGPERVGTGEAPTE